MTAMHTPPTKPRGRLAPSPTGNLHLGNAFAFLMAWLDMRSQGGTLLLRMEDIDPARSRSDFAVSLMEDLRWLGLNWDEGPDRSGPTGSYVQSERFSQYDALLRDFERRGLLYPCYCTRKELRTLASAPHIGDEGAPYPGLCRNLEADRRARLEAEGRRASLRINTDLAQTALGAPGAGIGFHDLVLGHQKIDLRDCGGDFALRRSDGVFAYQLAVAADDAAMGITHVVRGEDLLLSTPRQILLFHLMDETPPLYAHVPLLHDATGERLAKRHKALELASLRKTGVAPEAVIGYLGFLAGCLDQPKKSSPRDLLAGFQFAKLTTRALTLPPDITSTLLSL